MLARFWCVGFAVDGFMCRFAVYGIVLARLTELYWRRIPVCRFAVYGIVLAAHNALRCALMYLFVGWVAAFFRHLFVWGIYDSVSRKCSTATFDRTCLNATEEDCGEFRKIAEDCGEITNCDFTNCDITGSFLLTLL